ncbi:MAG: GNAT family N-acetyltransferase [Selenomonadaceae bacterium]|nr:GNAT family N-acetyltransferase [Selenomonadaceae bacterium]
MDDRTMLTGHRTILTEIEPRFFGNLVQWRNDKELNRYINQPFELTMELEERWYREVYCEDDSQMLYVMLDRATQNPFGTIGYVSFDAQRKTCISARLMAGERKYQGSPCLIEGLVLFFDHLYNDLGMETIYSHVVRENLASLRIQRRFGFRESEGPARFPEHLNDSVFPMVEIVGTRTRYEAGRRKVMELLEGVL